MQLEYVPTTNDEMRRVLVDHARGRFGKLRHERLAEAVLSATCDSDWAVRRAALDALIRRYAFAKRDGLAIVKRPARATLGAYSTAKGERGHARPYTTEIISLDPLRASCSCPDYLRGSLGLCKHALVVLEALEREGTLTAPRLATTHEAARTKLLWSPIHPWASSPDRLARLVVTGHDPKSPPQGFDRVGRARPELLQGPRARLLFIASLEQRIAKGALAAECAIPALLAEERARASRTRDMKKLAPRAREALRGLKRKLYPYQQEGISKFLEEGRLLLADDMGLGKTVQAIAACHALFQVRKVARGVLVVPAALKAQWRREWDATTDTPLTVVDGNPDQRARIYRDTKRGYLIIGYEQLVRDFDRIKQWSPELVVLDEAQRIKNWATKSAACAKLLDAEYRLVLTGTPMENRFDELASLMDVVDDVALEPKWRLVPLHTQLDAGASRAAGAKNLDVLRARLSGVMLRRVRRDVLAQLPPRTDTRVPVEMTDTQLERHDELNQPIAQLVARAAKRPLSQPEFLRLMSMLTKQRIICNGIGQLEFEDVWPRCLAAPVSSSLLESLFAPKLMSLRQLVEETVVAQGRKAVVFSQWRNMIRLSEYAIRDILAAAGQRAVFFTGAESTAQRERAIVELHDDPHTTVMFLSDAGGVGLNLQRAASVCINLELPWNPAVLEQRIGRIYRLGQNKPIDVYNLVSESGIESRIATLVSNKRAVFTSLFDGTSDEVKFQEGSSFLEGVKKLVDPAEPVAALPALLGAEDYDASEGGETYEPARLVPERAPAPEASPPAFPASLGLQVQRLPGGGIRIDAPESLAAPLAQVFEELARALRASTNPTA